MIYYFAEDTDFPILNKKEITEWIKQVADFYHKKVGQISYIFCSDEYLLNVNKKFLNHNYYTDIITFDYSDKNIISGDVFISLETVHSNALQFSQTDEQELKRVIIHGILHLCGQKDKTDEERQEMIRKENHALQLFST